MAQIPYLEPTQMMGQDRDNSTAPGQYVPSSEEKALIKKLNKMFNEAKQERARYDEKWQDYYKMFRGKQWKEKRPSYRHSEVINLIFQAIQSMVPILTDTRPKMEYIPENPSDREFAEIINDVCASDWTSRNWLEILTEVIYDAHIFGTGLSYMTYDRELEMGLGAIEYCSLDPFYCFPDPDSTSTNTNARFFIEAKPTKLSKIKRDYPRKGKYVQADVADFETLNRTELYDFTYRNPADQVITQSESSNSEEPGKDEAIVIKCYWKCDDSEDTPTGEIDEFGQPVTQSKLKYPNGRYTVFAGQVVLEDGPNPFDDGQFPYQRLQNYVLPREFWGISEVEQLESPQKIFNKLVSFSLDVLTLMGNPVWVVDTTANIDVDNLVNKPGLIIEKEPNSEVKRMEGVQLQPYVLQLVDRMKVWFDGVSGAQDITRGVNPAGVTAASAIRELQDSAQTRMRQKSRNIDAYLQVLGQHYLSRALQFYTVPRVMRITGSDEVSKYFKFSVDKQTDEMGNEVKIAKVRPYNEGADGKHYLGEEKAYQIEGQFKVRVSTGSTLPFSKVEKENKLLNYFDRGIIDQEEVLKGSDYPNYEAVLNRMQQKAEAQAQAEQQNQMQGAQ